MPFHMCRFVHLPIMTFCALPNGLKKQRSALTLAGVAMKLEALI